ncbi:MAG TPA: DUF1801 domain-containing protein [Planctomycetota bacterium]|nr:DUF1801 domain-containing protein [Planctomycetota bacterium]
MAKTDFKSIDDYMQAQPAPVRSILQSVRAAIGKAVPDAEEAISYQLPTFKLHGRAIIHFAGWKQHYSIYPATDGLAEAFRKELAGYEISKGTIRFPLSEPVPLKLIARLAKYRAKVAAESETAKKR